MINVLVVEDSPVVREFLVQVLSSDPEICVVGSARNGEEALEAVESKKPDVITMDVHMPKMNGVEATRTIMQTRPTPIVVVSGSTGSPEAARAFRALEAGALAVVQKPSGIGHPDHAQAVAKLVETVKLMSEVKVVRRWSHPRPKPAVPPVPEGRLGPAPAGVQLVAIGASTGGPQALRTILSGLPKDFPAPVLVVQHMTPGFTEAFVEWLGGFSPLPVHTGKQGEAVLPGQIYVAPDGVQMKVMNGGKLSLTTDDPENGHRPSVSCLFRAVAEVYSQNAVGILLTGMGKDGAEELKLMRDIGAITIAQDRESSIVYGMPGEAAELGAAIHILSPDQMPALLIVLADRRPARGKA